MAEEVTFVTHVRQLIEKAGKRVGSEYQLAKALGVPQSHVSGWKSGALPCQPPDRARIAGFAREDAAQELIRATLERHKGTLRGEQLQKLLGKQSHQTGEALNSVLLLVASLTYASTMNDVLRCILGTPNRARYSLC